MRKLISLVGFILILTGVVLIAYTVRLTADVEEVVEESNNKAVSCYLDGGCSDVTYGEKEVKNLIGNLEVPEESKDLSQVSVTEDMIGVFYADKIDLVEPIYRGATFNNLARGVATVEDYNNFSDQNVSIAGHRVEGPDIRFNRIGELEEGDTIQIGVVNSKGEQELKEYKVSDKYLVSQYAVEEMEQSPGDSQELTLITCEGYDQLTNTWEERLIIKAKIVE